MAAMERHRVVLFLRNEGSGRSLNDARLQSVPFDSIYIRFATADGDCGVVHNSLPEAVLHGPFSGACGLMVRGTQGGVRPSEVLPQV